MNYNDGEIKKLYCSRCKEDVVPVYATQIFSNQTKHISARCSSCNKFLKYMPQNDGGDKKIFFGKHKGRAIKEVPKDYLLWLLKKNVVKGSLREAIIKICN